MNRIIPFLLLFLALPAPLLCAEEKPVAALAKESVAGAEKLFIRADKTGELYEFTVEIVQTPEEMQKGLSGRSELAPDHGMLFAPGTDRQMMMWMKDTLIPLDMLFIDKRGDIVYIAGRTQPNSTKIIGFKRAVRAVLELPGGTAKKLRIVTGDHVIHPLIQKDGKKKSSSAAKPPDDLAADSKSADSKPKDGKSKEAKSPAKPAAAKKP